MSDPQGSTYRSQFGVRTTGATSAGPATVRRLDALLLRLRRLETILLQIREAQDFRVVGREARQRRPHGDSYPALRTAIEKLKHQAEIARSAEASRAIRWIKRDIAEYGLAREDVGL
jgi:hypothetical protein